MESVERPRQRLYNCGMEKELLLIAGLGNPGKEYEHTRHNVGFDTATLLAEKFKAVFKRSRFKARVAKCRIAEKNCLIIKPLTFMNLSGEAVGRIAKFYKIPPSKILVIYDDADLDVGKVRIRMKGSSGGHRGMQSIISHLGSAEIPRVRIGIGSAADKNEMIGHVLGKFSPDERKLIDNAIETAISAAEVFVERGIDIAMNRYN